MQQYYGSRPTLAWEGEDRPAPWWIVPGTYEITMQYRCGDAWDPCFEIGYTGYLVSPDLSQIPPYLTQFDFGAISPSTAYGGYIYSGANPITAYLNDRYGARAMQFANERYYSELSRTLPGAGEIYFFNPYNLNEFWRSEWAPGYAVLVKGMDVKPRYTFDAALIRFNWLPSDFMVVMQAIGAWEDPIVKFYYNQFVEPSQVQAINWDEAYQDAGTKAFWTKAIISTIAAFGGAAALGAALAASAGGATAASTLFDLAKVAYSTYSKFEQVGDIDAALDAGFGDRALPTFSESAVQWSTVGTIDEAQTIALNMLTQARESVFDGAPDQALLDEARELTLSAAVLAHNAGDIQTIETLAAALKATEDAYASAMPAALVAPGEAYTMPEEAALAPIEAGFPWWLLLAVPATMFAAKGKRKGARRVRR